MASFYLLLYRDVSRGFGVISRGAVVPCHVNNPGKVAIPANIDNIFHNWYHDFAPRAFPANKARQLPFNVNYKFFHQTLFQCCRHMCTCLFLVLLEFSWGAKYGV